MNPAADSRVSSRGVTGAVRTRASDTTKQFSLGSHNQERLHNVLQEVATWSFPFVISTFFFFNRKRDCNSKTLLAFVSVMRT